MERDDIMYQIEFTKKWHYVSKNDPYKPNVRKFRGVFIPVRQNTRKAVGLAP